VKILPSNVMNRPSEGFRGENFRPRTKRKRKTATPVIEYYLGFGFCKVIHLAKGLYFSLNRHRW